MFVTVAKGSARAMGCLTRGKKEVPKVVAIEWAFGEGAVSNAVRHGVGERWHILQVRLLLK